MTRHATYFLCLLFLALFAMMAAQELKEPIVISGRASVSEMFIGDHITYDLTVEWDKGYSILQVEPPLELGKFEILEVKSATEGAPSGGRMSRTYSYILSTYDTGEFEIPPFTITYQLPSGEKKKALSQPLKIRVKPIPHTAADKNDIRDPKRPIDIPPKPYLRNFLLMAGAALLFIALASFIIFRYIRMRRMRKPEETLPLRPAWELALEELSALEGSPLLAQGKFKEYYTRAADIIRVYLGRLYRINAMEMTSWELLCALVDTVMEPPNREVLERLLERCDMVKFAKHLPKEPEHVSTLEEARLLIRRTTPAPAPPQPEPLTPPALQEGGAKA
jgi:hypothetical protein